MNKKIMWIAIAIIVIGGGILLLVREGKKPGKYDALAQCISDSGAKFYGAWWCPHCQSQKAAFGKAAAKLPYIECQTRGRETTEACVNAEIKSYPTWEFADGSRETGQRSLDVLAEKTNCALPE